MNEEFSRTLSLLRQEKGVSQDVYKRQGISVTHMSHIETGNTKLSLAVFAALAEGLGVAADELLRDAPESRTASLSQLEEVLAGCTRDQCRVILAVARAARAALNEQTDPSLH